MDADTVGRAIRGYILGDLRPGVLDPEDLDAGTPLVSGGLVDSLAVARIAVFIEERFGIRIPDARLTLENVDSIDAFTELVLECARRGR